MNGMSGVPGSFYRFLLRLYPPRFRSEFGEQMLLDFSDLARDAREKGKLSLGLFYLREIVQFPASLLQLYGKEVHKLGIFQRPPVNIGLRAAVAFGVSLAFYYALEWLMYVGLEALGADKIQNEQVIRKTILILEIMRSLLGGLALGGLLAIFFAERSQYSRFILLSIFVWFLNDAVFYVFENWKGSYFDNVPLGLARAFRLLVSGAHLSLIFGLLTSEKPKPVGWWLVGVLAHPVFVYFYLRFEWSMIGDRLSAPAVMVLIMLVIASVTMLARKNDDGERTLLIVALGTIIYPLVVMIGAVFLYRLVFPGLPDRIDFAQPYSSYVWPLVGITLARAAGGMLFGFLVGCIRGVEETGRPGAVAVEL